MDAITIPVGKPLSFPELRALNPNASVEEIADAFERLPGEMQQQAWAQAALRAGLECWNNAAGETP
jgi:hypothetical protein